MRTGRGKTRHSVVLSFLLFVARQKEEKKEPKKRRKTRCLTVQAVLKYAVAVDAYGGVSQCRYAVVVDAYGGASQCKYAVAVDASGGVSQCKYAVAYGVILFLSRGNMEASFTFGRFNTFCVRRSSPIAQPPCGGQPYLKIER